MSNDDFEWAVIIFSAWVGIIAFLTLSYLTIYGG